MLGCQGVAAGQVAARCFQLPRAIHMRPAAALCSTLLVAATAAFYSADAFRTRLPLSCLHADTTPPELPACGPAATPRRTGRCDPRRTAAAKRPARCAQLIEGGQVGAMALDEGASSAHLVCRGEGPYGVLHGGHGSHPCRPSWGAVCVGMARTPAGPAGGRYV